MKTLTQKGFGLLPILLIVVVVGLVAFAAYRIMDKNAEVADTTSQQTTDSAGPDSIKNAEDLDAADKALDDTSIDEGMNAEQLDSDVDSLL